MGTEICCDCSAVNLLREVIAVNQDPLGVQGRLIKSTSVKGERRVYSRPLKNGDVAVALLNVSSFSSPKNITFELKEVRSCKSLRTLYQCIQLRVTNAFLYIHSPTIHDHKLRISFLPGTSILLLPPPIYASPFILFYVGWSEFNQRQYS